MQQLGEIKYLEQQQISFEWIEHEILTEDSSMQIDIELPYDLLKDELRRQK